MIHKTAARAHWWYGIFSICLVASLTSQVIAKDEIVIHPPNPVTIHMEADKAQIKVGNESFATFNFSKEFPKPFFYPVYAPGEEKIVRDIDWSVKEELPKAVYDHVHHKGIWIGLEDLNGYKFWTEKERVVNQSVKDISPSDHGTGILEVINLWTPRDQPAIMKETTRITILPQHVLEYEIQLESLVDKLEFHDTKDAFLAARIANDLRETSGGVMTNSHGTKTEKNCFGQEAEWVSYIGTRNGKALGLTFFDDPQNFRKSRYFARGYGLLGINPFGPHAYTEKSAHPLPRQPVVLPKGEKFNLRFGIYIHAGDVDSAHVADEYRNFVTRHPIDPITAQGKTPVAP
jgi:hypothetical protein